MVIEVVKLLMLANLFFNMQDNLFSGQSVEVEGKVVFDFSDINDIYCRKLLVDINKLNTALLNLSLIDKETPVKIIIQTL